MSLRLQAGLSNYLVLYHMYKYSCLDSSLSLAMKLLSKYRYESFVSAAAVYHKYHVRCTGQNLAPTPIRN